MRVGPSRTWRRTVLRRCTAVSPHSFVGLPPDPAPFVAGVAASVGDRAEDLDLLRQTGSVVYLRATVPTLAARVGSGADRPWLAGDPAAWLAASLDRREPAYLAAADVVVDVDVLGPDAVARVVVERLLASVGVRPGRRGGPRMSDERVVVVGGGAMGAATAWFLARSGQPVTLLEQYDAAHTHGSSHGSSRIFRFSYEDQDYVDLGVEAQGLWRTLEEESGRQLVTQVGCVDHGPREVVGPVHAALVARGVRCDLASPRRGARAMAGPALRRRGPRGARGRAGRRRSHRGDPPCGGCSARVPTCGPGARRGPCTSVTVGSRWTRTRARSRGRWWCSRPGPGCPGCSPTGR